MFSTPHPFLYVIFVVLAWIATSQRLWVTCAAILIVDSAAVWSAVVGRGPFTSPVISETLWHFQAFVLAAAVCALVLYALAAERRRALYVARRHNEQLRKHIKEQHGQLGDIRSALEEVRKAKDAIQ